MIFKERIKPIFFASLQICKFLSSSSNPNSLIDPFHVSKLLSSYFKLGRIRDAEKLFEEIPNKNIFSFSIMIHGYATNGFHREALKIFSQLQISDFMPNSFTMVGILLSSAGLQNLVLGQSLHGLILKNGFESNLFVGTTILDMYSKCGFITDSYKFFKKISNPSLISYNAMVAGFIYNELFEEAFLLFDHGRRSGLSPNSVTMLSVIQGCVALESHKVSELIHSLVFKTGFCSDLSVNNSVLYMYSNLGDLNAASKIFEDVKHKDVITWTTIIGLLVRLEKASDALDIFFGMRSDNVNLDMVILVNLTIACALLGDLKKGQLVHSQSIVHGFGLELLIANSIIAMYSKCGDLDSSISVFERIMEKSLVSWTVLISGYVQNGRPRDALDLLYRMRLEENFNLDSIVLISLLTACGELANLELCKRLHCYAFKACFSLYKSVQNSLVSTYSKCGEVEIARKVFDEMGFWDIVSWNAIISGYGVNGFGEGALALFREMEISGEELDSVSYLSVLSACSHSGLVDEGVKIFNRMMEEKKIRPTREICGCFIDMLARAGRLYDAIGFMREFSEGMDLNSWRALLGGCLKYENVGMAEFAVEKVSNLGFENSDHVVLLSNVYTSVGRYQEAENLRLGMGMKRLAKNPGISLLNGK